MVHKFIIAKDFLKFELQIDGTVSVKPLRQTQFSEETVDLMARAHQAILWGQQTAHNKKNLVAVAIEYFDKKGFDISVPGELE